MRTTLRLIAVVLCLQVVAGAPLTLSAAEVRPKGLALLVPAEVALETGAAAAGDIETDASSALAALQSSEGAWDVTLGNPGPSSYVESLEVAQDWLYVGGDFFGVAGLLGYGYVARWNIRSQQWDSLGGGVGGGASTHVYETMVSPDGRYVFVGGIFDTAYNAFNRNDPIPATRNPNLARWDTQTRTWQVFQSTETYLYNAWTDAYALLDGQLYVGGVGQFIGDDHGVVTGTVGLARWSGDPFAETLVGEWEGVGGGLVYQEGDEFWWKNVNVLEPLTDGRLLVGGGFSQVADQPGSPPITVNHIATWDPATGHWSGFGNGVWESVLAVDVSGADVVVGGAQGVIATCNPAGCALLAGGLGPVDGTDYNPRIHDLESIGGMLYAGGSFNRDEYGSPADRLARLEEGQWVEVGGGVDRFVFALASDGRYLYVGGCMHQVGSKPVLYLARWDTQGGAASPWAIQDVVVAEYVLGTPLGTGTWLALDSVGNPHISYFDGGPDDLLYASWDGLGWITETVDGTGNTGHYPTMALDAADRPHISYYNSSTACLRYAHWDGSGWISQTVDCAGGIAGFRNGTLALDINGYPHLSYRYYDDEDVVSQLRYARWDGTQWLTQTVASGFMDTGIGIDSSLVLDGAGNPHLSYVNVNWDVGNLQYASWNGSQWVLETVDGSGQVGGSNNTRQAGTSLELDGAGYPHVSYYNTTNGDPMYAYQDGTGWRTEVVSDSADVIGQSNSLALDTEGNPHITFYNATRKVLQYAVKTGAGWEVQTVDADGDVGTWSSLALDHGDNPHISYYFKLDPNNGVRYAALPGENPNSGVVSGPPLAEPGAPVRMEVAADMPGAVLPITFTWEVAGQGAPTGTLRLQSIQGEPIVHVVNGFTDSLTLTWDEMGRYEVTVSIISRNGLAAVASFEITVGDIRSVYLPCVSK